MKYLIPLVFLTFFFTSDDVIAQKVKTINFEVDAVCEMCKERIEGAVDVKGVKIAEYDLLNHQLAITFSTKKISEDEIHQLISDAGHDTEKVKASDEAYAKIYHCCKYREAEQNH